MKRITSLIKAAIWSFAMQAAVYILFTRILPAAVGAFAPDISAYTGSLTNAKVGWEIYVRIILWAITFTALLPEKIYLRALCLIACFILTLISVRLNSIPLLIAAKSAVSVLSAL